MATVPRLAWWCVCRCRLDLRQCLHLSRDLYHPPQARLCNTLLLCIGALWETVTSSSTTTGLCLWVSIDVQYTFLDTGCTQLVHVWGLLACIVLVGVKYACDITTALVMAWLMSSLLLVWIISPVCLSVCLCVWTSVKAQILVGVFFLFFVGVDRLQSQRVPIVAIPIISVSLLWLVLCQLVATAIGCSGKGHDPADGSIVSVWMRHSSTHECLQIALNTYTHKLAQWSQADWDGLRVCTHTKGHWQTLTYYLKQRARVW